MAASSQHRVGETIAGRFRLIALLGEGGFGVAYRAWDSRQGVPVVLKQPLAKHGERPDVLARFDREITRLLELSHPHIVPIIDHGHDNDGLPYLAMRFLPAGSLANRKTPQPFPYLHNWLPGVAAALDYVHARGVVHRDVKPANIFLDTRNAAYLGDFGIAKVIDDEIAAVAEHSLTSTGGEIGTYPYMAPEYFQKPRVLTGAYDQYALAITVYEMIAGRRPFSGDSGQLILAHAIQDPPDIRDFRPEAPESLCDALTRALSKKPQDRFDCCKSLAAALLRDIPAPSDSRPHYQFLCPGCARLVRVPAAFSGKGCRCPNCGVALSVSENLDALWKREEDPRAIHQHERDHLPEPTVAISRVTANDTVLDTGRLAATQSNRPWGCMTVAALNLLALLVAIGSLPAGYLDGRVESPVSLAVAGVLVVAFFALFGFVTSLIFTIVGFFVRFTEEDLSRTGASVVVRPHSKPPSRAGLPGQATPSSSRHHPRALGSRRRTAPEAAAGPQRGFTQERQLPGRVEGTALDAPRPSTSRFRKTLLWSLAIAFLVAFVSCGFAKPGSAMADAGAVSALLLGSTWLVLAPAFLIRPER